MSQYLKNVFTCKLYFARIDIILESFAAILINIKAWVTNLRSITEADHYRNPLPNSFNYCKYYASRWIHFSNTGSVLLSSTTILVQYCNNTCKYWAGEYTLNSHNNLTKTYVTKSITAKELIDLGLYECIHLYKMGRIQSEYFLIMLRSQNHINDLIHQVCLISCIQW